MDRAMNSSASGNKASNRLNLVLRLKYTNTIGLTDASSPIRIPNQCEIGSINQAAMVEARNVSQHKCTSRAGAHFNPACSRKSPILGPRRYLSTNISANLFLLAAYA